MSETSYERTTIYVRDRDDFRGFVFRIREELGLDEIEAREVHDTIEQFARDNREELVNRLQDSEDAEDMED